MRIYQNKEASRGQTEKPGQAPASRAGKPPVQQKSFYSPLGQAASNPVNRTGIPEGLKRGYEAAGGFPLDDVRVHYNSPRPAQLQALAYTQGNQVYVSPGQERHLGHELGHVIQQKQGRVKPTGQIGGQPINTSQALEREADGLRPLPGPWKAPASNAAPFCGPTPIQGKFAINYNEDDREWSVENAGRPDFKPFIEKFFPRGEGQSLNHVISFDLINSTMQAALRQGLEGKKPSSFHGAPPVSSEGQSLRRLAKAVIPAEADVIPFFPEIEENDYSGTIKQQRQQALSLVNNVSDEMACSPSIPRLTALADGLEDVLNSSVGNLRLGNASVNSGLGARIDPVAGSYTLKGSGTSADPHFVEFDGAAGDAAPVEKQMAKRMHKLARLRADLPGAEMRLPRVADVLGTERVEDARFRSGYRKVDTHTPTVYSSDLDLPTDMKTLSSHALIRHRKKGKSGIPAYAVQHEISTGTGGKAGTQNTVAVEPEQVSDEALTAAAEFYWENIFNDWSSSSGFGYSEEELGYLDERTSDHEAELFWERYQELKNAMDERVIPILKDSLAERIVEAPNLTNVHEIQKKLEIVLESEGIAYKNFIEEMEHIKQEVQEEQEERERRRLADEEEYWWQWNEQHSYSQGWGISDSQDQIGWGTSDPQGWGGQ